MSSRNRGPIPRTDVTTTVRTMQVIAGALMTGTLLFGAVAVFVRAERGAGPEGPLFAIVAAGLSVVMIVLRFVLPSLIVGPLRTNLMKEVRSGEVRDADAMAPKLYGLFQTRLIIGLALLEGAAMFNEVAYLLEGHWWSLAAAGILLFLMAAQFPTKNRLENWVHDQLQLMEMEQTAAD